MYNRCKQRLEVSRPDNVRYTGYMHIREKVSLRKYSTMRLGGIAAYLADITSRDELVEALAWAAARKLPVVMIGTGSNIVWRDEGFAGLVLVNKITGFETRHEDGTYTIAVGAGELWDEVVARTVHAGLTGIESLSLIPGTAGATPVQNVGAYGQEIKNVLTSVTAYDHQQGRFVELPASDCGFGYRTSRFKAADRGRFFIVSITLQLRRGAPMPPFYPALQTYLDEHNIHDTSPQTVRNAVIAIRRSKLPDPAQIANNGSFFANPVLSETAFRPLQALYPAMPNWPTTGGMFKIPAAWLLEQAGFKNTHDAITGMATWPTQPLVLINEHAGSTADLLAFKQKIAAAVQAKFGITLEQEPELLP